MFGREQNRENAFETQFEQRQSLDFLGGTIEAVDIRPEKSSDEVPVVVAPGWSETPEVFKDSLKVLAGEGRRAISFAHPMKGAEVEPRQDYPIAELRKALALLTVLEEKHFESVDVVAHSEGAINVAIAASLHPEKFRNIVFVGPAGMMGPDKFVKLTARFSRNLIESSLKTFLEPSVASRRLKGGAAAAGYSAVNFSNALKESIAISESDIRNMLHDLHEKGIGISVIHGVDDKVFPMDKVQQYTQAQEVDGFYSVKGDHNEIYVHPEQYMSLANQALMALRDRKQK